MGGFKPRLELPNPTGPGVQTVQFPVPGGKCGLVIGKGTCTLRRILHLCAVFSIGVGVMGSYRRGRGDM